jgi:hypothetical protein
VKRAALLIALCAARLAFAQAEPAPPEFQPFRNEPVGDTPQQHESSRLTPRFFLTLSPRFDIRLGDPPASLPKLGYGGGVQFAAALLSVGPARAGLAFSFAYDHFEHRKDEVISSDTLQFASHGTFAFSLYLDALVGRVRPWAQIGGGFDVADYENPTQTTAKNISDVAVAPIFRAALGISVLITKMIELGGHGEVISVFSHVSDGSPPQTVFSPGLVSVTLDLGFRF